MRDAFLGRGGARWPRPCPGLARAPGERVLPHPRPDLSELVVIRGQVPQRPHPGNEGFHPLDPLLGGGVGGEKRSTLPGSRCCNSRRRSKKVTIPRDGIRRQR
jgi:hypothetical protein